MMGKRQFGSVSDYSKQISRIRTWTKQLRELRPPKVDSWESPSDWVVKDANVYGDPVRSLTITLTPTGCAWARESGGCTMCGEYEGSAKGKMIAPEFHLAQFAAALGRLIPEHRPSWLRIYQEGNYANADEVSSSVRALILRLAGTIKGLRRITVESMAKYLTAEAVLELRDVAADDVELEVGMGLEAENAVVRNVCVNKGESLQDFRSAIARLREAGIRSLAYVLLKPPFLTEAEAIGEAISTIEVASKLGFDAVSLEPLSIHPYTLTHALNLAGLCRPPWLWSVLEVAKSATQLQDFRIGGIGYYPRPSNVAHNRHPAGDDRCSRDLWEAIREYGKHRSFDAFDGLSCDCMSEWNRECQLDEIPLPERIDGQLDMLDLDRYADQAAEWKHARPRIVDDALPSTGETQFDRGPQPGGSSRTRCQAHQEADET